MPPPVEQPPTAPEPEAAADALEVPLAPLAPLSPAAEAVAAAAPPQLRAARALRAGLEALQRRVLPSFVPPQALALPPPSASWAAGGDTELLAELERAHAALEALGVSLDAKADAHAHTVERLKSENSDFRARLEEASGDGARAAAAEGRVERQLAVGAVERDLSALRAERAAAGAAHRAAMDACDARRRAADERCVRAESSCRAAREELQACREAAERRERAAQGVLAEAEDQRAAAAWRLGEARRAEARARAEVELLRTHQKFFRSAKGAQGEEAGDRPAAVPTDKLDLAGLCSRLQRELEATRAEADELRERALATERAVYVARLAHPRPTIAATGVADAAPLTTAFATAMASGAENKAPPAELSATPALGALVPPFGTPLVTPRAVERFQTAPAPAQTQAEHVPVAELVRRKMGQMRQAQLACE